MNKKEQVDRIHTELKRQGLSGNRKNSEEIYETVFNTLREEILKGKSVILYDFGTFHSVLRTFSNPQDVNKTVERFVLKFKPSAYVKKMLNEKIKK